MRGAALHLILCVIAAATPLVTSNIPTDPARATARATARTTARATARATAQDDAFPGWPTTFEGRPLRELPAVADDERFVADTGGRIARFTDGEQEILVRWSATPTRHLHPSAVCYEAVGWTVTPAPRRTDPSGQGWTTHTMERDGERRTVRECVIDATGASWPDPIDWYWASLLGRTEGPAFAYTVVTLDDARPR